MPAGSRARDYKIQERREGGAGSSEYRGAFNCFCGAMEPSSH